MTRLALLTQHGEGDQAVTVDGVVAHLRATGIDVVGWPGDADGVVVWTGVPLPADVRDAVLARAAGGTPVLLAGPTLRSDAGCNALAEAAGLVTAAVTPRHETRLRPGPHAGEVAARLEGDVVVTDAWVRVDKVVDDVEVLMTASAGLTEHAVMTWRPATNVGVFSVAAGTSATADDPAYRRLLHRWVRHSLGLRDAPRVRVGILGYGAIGHEHNAAIAAVDGLALSAVCDKNPLRIDAARTLAPDLLSYDDGDDLLASDGVDLVIVSTPPNTHAEWALRALDAGKHVVVEKPFCLTTAEADEMLAAAAAAGRALTVYQNRRWDVDYLALKRLVRSGAIGDVFHYESFVGSYGHPCNFWHSDEEVSGGAIYDWGSHYLDWALDLFPQEVAHVTAATHKRVWHDVTNADHSRVTVRFADGVEAEFVHSDLAAAMKPKWYVLGTSGAIVGQWRTEKVVARNPVGNLVEDVLAASESPAVLSLHAPDGSVTSVALPPMPRHPFHRELADLLLSGAPMSVTPVGSRRNIAVMEAATLSARDAGRPVTPS